MKCISKLGRVHIFWTIGSGRADVHKAQMVAADPRRLSAVCNLQQWGYAGAQEDRTQKLDQLAALEASVKQSAAELAKYADNDPEKLDAMSKYSCRKSKLCLTGIPSACSPQAVVYTVNAAKPHSTV